METNELQELIVDLNILTSEYYLERRAVDRIIRDKCRIKIVQYLGSKCSRCAETENIKLCPTNGFAWNEVDHRIDRSAIATRIKRYTEQLKQNNIILLCPSCQQLRRLAAG